MVPAASTSAATKKLVILYGIGGLSDVGRHAILAALEQQEIVKKITVITEYPELLDEANWECGCVGGHTNPVKDHPDKIDVVKINESWNDESTSHVELLKRHFHGTDAVISCLGHRQPGWKYKDLVKKGIVAYNGNKQVIQAMEQTPSLTRAVVISSMGIEEDYPPMEFHWAGRIMKWLFKGPCKKSFVDLTEMEKAYKASSVDYLFVRPVGISEDYIPENQWYIQKQKGHDSVGMNMAKMDVARYMVQEAIINPTKHKVGVVIGSAPPAKSSKKKKITTEASI